MQAMAERMTGRIKWAAAAMALACGLVYTGAMAQAPAPEYSHGPAGPASVQPVRTGGRPNVIFILADDIGVEGFNTYGGEYYTPTSTVWRGRAPALPMPMPCRCAALRVPA
jgi:hypothetical protein